MALTTEEVTLLKIIEYNQKKIEELLLSRSKAYQNNAIVQVINSDKSKSIVQGSGYPNRSRSVPDKAVPQILTSFFKDSAEDSEVQEHRKESYCNSGTKTNVIVDHSVPGLPVSCNEAINQSTAVTDKQSSGSIKCNESMMATNTEMKQVSVPIPGLGDCPPIPRNPSEPVVTLADIAVDPLPKRNVWVISKNGKRRKKARSSSPSDTIKRAMPPSKRKRCNSLTSASSSSTTDPVGASNLIKCFTKKSVELTPKIPVVVEKDEPEFSGKITSGNNCTYPVKKRTVILSSPLMKKNHERQSSPNNHRKPIKFDVGEKLAKGEPEPYVACWAHCPAISTRIQSDHCVPRHLFMDHLRQYHTPPTYINLVNQQIVCMCRACETVVPHSFQLKSDHLDQRCTQWQQQFFLFIEPTQDDYGIPDINVPVVKSPGLAGMFKSIAHHRHLDTLTWKNVKGEHFCYHYCMFCNGFVEDSLRAVSDHIATALHRVNVRKAGG